MSLPNGHEKIQRKSSWQGHFYPQINKHFFTKSSFLFKKGEKKRLFTMEVILLNVNNE